MADSNLDVRQTISPEITKVIPENTSEENSNQKVESKEGKSKVKFKDEVKESKAKKKKNKKPELPEDVKQELETRKLNRIL